MSFDPRGRGLRFDGYPNDVKMFHWILNQEGCHPKAVDRILQRIADEGYDLLTVRDSLNFDYIREQLDVLGVKMTFIDPLDNWSPVYNDGPWPEELIRDIFKQKGR